MYRRRFLAAAGGAATVALAGCAGNGTPTPTGMGGAPTESPTRTPTDSPTATQTSRQTNTPTGQSVGQREYPDYNWELLEDTTPQFTTEIALRNQSFHPVIAEVPVESVRFVNEDDYEHTVTIPALDVDETLSGGSSAEISVSSAGEYDYVCELHPPSMLGRLLAVEETPTPTESPTPTPTSTPGDTPTETPTEGSDYY